MHRPRAHRSLHRVVALVAASGLLALDAAPLDAQPNGAQPNGAQANGRPPQLAPQAPAQRVMPSEVAGEVYVVLASEQDGTIAPELAAMPALRQPPFNAFRSMQLLLRPTIRLTVGQPHTLQLPNGRNLQLVLEEITPEGRYRVRVSINRPDRQDYLPLLEVVAPPGDPFFLAGQSFMGGTLVLGVRLGERAPR